MSHSTSSRAAGPAGVALLVATLLMADVVHGFQRIPPVIAPMCLVRRPATSPTMAAEQQRTALGPSSAPAGDAGVPRGVSTSGNFGYAVRQLLGALAALTVGSVAPPASAWGRADSAGHAAVQLENSASREKTEVKIGVVGLQPGWEQQVDPHSGKTFYINHQTKQWSWDRPQALQGDAQGAARRRDPVALRVGAAGVAVASGVWAAGGLQNVAHYLAPGYISVRPRRATPKVPENEEVEDSTTGKRMHREAKKFVGSKRLYRFVRGVTHIISRNLRRKKVEGYGGASDGLLIQKAKAQDETQEESLGTGVPKAKQLLLEEEEAKPEGREAKKPFFSSWFVNKFGSQRPENGIATFKGRDIEESALGTVTQLRNSARAVEKDAAQQLRQAAELLEYLEQLRSRLQKKNASGAASTELMLVSQLLENLNLAVKRFQRQRALLEEQRMELDWLLKEGVEVDEEQFEDAVRLQQELQKLGKEFQLERTRIHQQARQLEYAAAPQEEEKEVAKLGKHIEEDRQLMQNEQKEQKELAARKREGDAQLMAQLLAAAKLQQELLSLATQFEADRALILEQQDLLDLSLETEEERAAVAQRLQQQLKAIKVQFDRDRARLREQEEELEAFKRAEDEQLQLAAQLQHELIKLGKQFQRDRALLIEQRAELKRLKAAGRGTGGREAGREDGPLSAQDAELQERMLSLSQRFEEDRAVILSQEEELRQVKAHSATELAALQENLKKLALSFEDEIASLHRRQQQQQRQMLAAHEQELEGERARLTAHLHNLELGFKKEREALQAQLQQQQQELTATAETEAHKAGSLQTNLTTLANDFESEVLHLTRKFEAERAELQQLLMQQKKELEFAVSNEAEQQQQAAALKMELSKITDKLEKDRKAFIEQEKELARLKIEGELERITLQHNLQKLALNFGKRAEFYYSIYKYTYTYTHTHTHTYICIYGDINTWCL